MHQRRWNERRQSVRRPAWLQAVGAPSAYTCKHDPLFQRPRLLAHWQTFGLFSTIQHRRNGDLLPGCSLPILRRFDLHNPLLHGGRDNYNSHSVCRLQTILYPHLHNQICRRHPIFYTMKCGLLSQTKMRFDLQWNDHTHRGIDLYLSHGHWLKMRQMVEMC